MAQMISIVLGTSVSLAFAYIPHLKEKFDALDGDNKRLLIALSGFIIAFALTFADYSGIIEIGTPRPFITLGLSHTLAGWLAFLGAAQGMYSAKSALDK